ncbi:hypothetical protein GCM10010174_73790 [Kutzneria viridogrisea]|uniref:Thiopeptide-type bacteriocin biosynthesis domain-containing protein n=2 Tax=Kutzneria TaxID=43356 RepID=W5W7P4_9PSEU|nr:thiopeptide maturation pyridine synthase [Kutzneria albida]AHH96962.1 hypothetical protein KALB_3598 [Kutzneria albida DSM 43870]MBA8932073.1 hypothetical protein [Kutzneria viridogrisea]
MTWRSVHVYYYEDRKYDLVLDAVRPLFQRLGPEIRAYHVPHWLRGPHLRLNFHTGSRQYADLVLPAVHEVIGGYLAEHPSTAVYDKEEMLAGHRLLIESEQERGQLEPLAEDNSLHEAPYDQRLHVLGSTEAASLLADFYVDTTELTFAMTEALRSGMQRLRLAFDLMIATAHTLSGIGYARGFVSFRSHAEAFLSWVPQAGGLRPAWQRHYRLHSRSLVAQARQVVDSLDTGGSAVPWVHEWVRALVPYRRLGGQLIASGQISLDPPGPPPGSRQYFEKLASSPMHSKGSWQHSQVDRLWFGKYRLMLNYTYLHLTRLGLTPVERFLLCHLAANTAEEIFGVRALDVRFPVPGDPAATREVELGETA